MIHNSLPKFVKFARIENSPAPNFILNEFIMQSLFLFFKEERFIFPILMAQTAYVSPILNNSQEEAGNFAFLMSPYIISGSLKLGNWHRVLF